MKRAGKITEAIEKEAKGSTLADFAESLFGPAAAAVWPGFLSKVKSACGHAPGEGAGAVRLPLGNLLPAEVHV